MWQFMKLQAATEYVQLKLWEILLFLPRKLNTKKFNSMETTKFLDYQSLEWMRIHKLTRHRPTRQEKK